MKKSYFLTTLCITISFFLFSFLQPQGGKRPAKELTAKDKEVIIEIFKTIDDGLYRFQFSKEETFGTKSISPMSATQMRSGKQINFKNSISKTYFPVMNFWFVVSKPNPPADELDVILGKANASRLQAIINKYTGGPVK